MKNNFVKKKPVVVITSGGFDPIHPGHIRLFKEAKKLGDKLIVLINNDNWAHLKKGKAPFMPAKERKEVIESIRYVDEVVLTSHRKGTKDISVCKDLERIRPDIFAKGGDRTYDNIPEVALCEKLGIKMIFNIGGGKIQSSSWLLDKYAKTKKMKEK